MLAGGQQLSAVDCLAHRARKNSEALLGSLGLLGGATRPPRKQVTAAPKHLFATLGLLAVVSTLTYT